MEPVPRVPDAEDEPEGSTSSRPTAQKKSLEQFLVEFEARVREAPSQPATSAGLALEQRAAGVRKTTIESTADRALPRVRHTTTPATEAAPPVEVREAVGPPADAATTTTPADSGRHRRRRHKHRRHGH